MIGTFEDRLIAGLGNNLPDYDEISDFPVTFTVRKVGVWLPMSIEFIDDGWFPLPRKWSREEWAVEVDRLRRVRRILEGQPLAAVKAAATRELRRAERVREFPHTTWEAPRRWHDLDDEGRPKEKAD